MGRLGWHGGCVLRLVASGLGVNFGAILLGLGAGGGRIRMPDDQERHPAQPDPHLSRACRKADAAADRPPAPAVRGSGLKLPTRKHEKRERLSSRRHSLPSAKLAPVFLFVRSMGPVFAAAWTELAEQTLKHMPLKRPLDAPCSGAGRRIQTGFAARTCAHIRSMA